MHSGAKGLAQRATVAICGIQTQALVSPLEHKPPALTTRPPLLYDRFHLKRLRLFPKSCQLDTWDLDDQLKADVRSCSRVLLALLLFLKDITVKHTFSAGNECPEVCSCFSCSYGQVRHS
ncbi:hypothetical protein ILYODFUR_021165 [Ilyodon furcidens]|uniref:Uncharacterized protein n=1 Tax=Ilyodon furcidens TaxID=33524 RepID=A0ABV0TN97_9TELE